ncbi:hypothetical protein JR316_0008776 [Psilocybe cubensis]|uniref:Uncharacterized protein n=1 Tax=Psilocybe cubensis TaxID=181762 RepID=A0ACB8GRE8_PSICU|nr:hypothetical protein JR316_0008776 [Psilocybe cubensis]KAH9478323.1 hypothetical protein JR316_0008776 [Psilocybe cubensis]
MRLVGFYRYQQQLQHAPSALANAKVSPEHDGGPFAQMYVQAMRRSGSGTSQQPTFPQHPGPPFGAKPAGQVGGEKWHSFVQTASSEAATTDAKARTEATIADSFLKLLDNPQYLQQFQQPLSLSANANESPPHCGGVGKHARVHAIGRSGGRQHLTFPQHPGPPAGAKPAGQVGGEKLHSRVQRRTSSESANVTEAKASAEAMIVKYFIAVLPNVRG